MNDTVIMSQYETDMVMLSAYPYFYANGECVYCKESNKDKLAICMGKYQSREKAVFALGMMAAACAAGERSFQFPQPEDIEFQQYGKCSVSNRHNRHGGS